MQRRRKQKRSRRPRLRPLALIVQLLFAVVLVTALTIYFRLPSRSNTDETLFQGVTYHRRVLDSPRPIVMHIAEVDLTAPGIKLFVTPGVNGQFKARTASEFLTDFGANVAINASLFTPYWATSPFTYYPHSGDFVSVNGQVISFGAEHSPPMGDWWVVCITDKWAVSFVNTRCPRGTYLAAAGQSRMLTGGLPVKDSNPTALEVAPRSAVAVDESGKKLLLFAVDGRQPYYSEGITQNELAELMVRNGAFDGMSLDGGGSTELAIRSASGVRILSSPDHTRVPTRERPVAVHLGVFVAPQ